MQAINPEKDTHGLPPAMLDNSSYSVETLNKVQVLKVVV